MVGMKITHSEDCLQNLQNSLASMDNELSRLDHQIHVLLDSWEGEARDAFLKSIQEWHRSAGNLHSIAVEAVGLAQEHVSDISEFERNRASAWLT